MDCVEQINVCQRRQKLEVYSYKKSRVFLTLYCGVGFRFCWSLPIEKKEFLKETIFFYQSMRQVAFYMGAEISAR